MKRIIVSTSTLSDSTKSNVVASGNGNYSMHQAKLVEKALRNALNVIEGCSHETYNHFCLSEIHEQLMDAVKELSIELHPVE